MTTKQFKTIDVLQVYTGFCLVDGGWNGIHEVMDHFYPGIMTLGCAAMSDLAASEIERQHPELKALTERIGAISEKNWESWRDSALKELPPTMELCGDLRPSEATIEAQFKKAFA